MSKMAVGSPGKFGDTLYTCPSIKFLTQLHGCKTDFYTSQYCAPLRRLLEYQPWVDEFIVPETYVIRDHGCGTQPWEMQPHMRPGYDLIYDLGFRYFPDRPLPDFVLHQYGIEVTNLSCVGTFNYPFLPKVSFEQCRYEPDKYVLDEPYVVVAPRGDLTRGPDGNCMKDIFYDFAAKCPIRIVQIGARGEAWPWEDSLDITGIDWLETLSWLEGAKGFYGIISSQGALAHNFTIPKVFPHNAGGWDMRHVCRTETTLFEVMPPAEQVLEFMGLR